MISSSLALLGTPGYHHHPLSTTPTVGWLVWQGFLTIEDAGRDLGGALGELRFIMATIIWRA